MNQHPTLILLVAVGICFSAKNSIIKERSGWWWSGQVIIRFSENKKVLGKFGVVVTSYSLSLSLSLSVSYCTESSIHENNQQVIKDWSVFLTFLFSLWKTNFSQQRLLEKRSILDIPYWSNIKDACIGPIIFWCLISSHLELFANNILLRLQLVVAVLSSTRP